MDFIGLLRDVGIAGALLAAFAWLLKAVVLKSIHVQGEIQLERIRSQERLREHEHRIRFSHFHEKRVQIIEGVFQRVTGAYRNACSATSIQRDPAHEGRVRELEATAIQIADLDEYLQVNRIHLPRDLAEMTRQLSASMFLAGSNYNMMIAHGGNDRRAPSEGLERARKKIREEAGPLLLLLEDAFRSELEGTRLDSARGPAKISNAS